ncbi:hypothetical protein PAXRUDRAFT_162975 [Paxillus rubicundulus Ve08.2h10]|uniref:Uncharacterized protein n=1 Tax=Paxillus rubicundulus Ve08.2h10 TaxID=930991 RepID=A0A0D0DDJ0_9AGAM|nr:hypothetical protein PAXRUDRAFT_162975 [Paxillus rubicundulus Ve08.2h10]
MSNPQPYVHTPQAPEHPIKPHSEATAKEPNMCSYIIDYSWTSNTYLAHVCFLEGLDALLHIQVVAFTFVDFSNFVSMTSNKEFACCDLTDN